MKVGAKRCPKCGGASTGTCSACAADQLKDGEGLPSAVRSRMEQGFGETLPDDVRIHTGQGAHSIADREGVRAFAVGHDVGFAAGEYRPSTPYGDALIAHELAHTLQPISGTPASERSVEADADRSAGAAMGRILGMTNAPARPPSRTAALSLHGCSKKPPGQGLGTGLKPGDDSKSYTLDEYIEMWEKQQGREMTESERKTLAAGCIGVTSTNLGGGNPKTDECYTSLPQAKKRADEMEDASGVRPFIFSKRFWSMGKPFPADPNGKVDMSNDTGDHPSGEVNFDYGWYDEKNDTWWHANHCDPVTGSDKCREHYDDPTDPDYRMEVKQSTLDYYSDPDYFEADKQVFCVAFSKLK